MLNFVGALPYYPWQKWAKIWSDFLGYHIRYIATSGLAIYAFNQSGLRVNNSGSEDLDSVFWLLGALVFAIYAAVMTVLIGICMLDAVRRVTESWGGLLGSVASIIAVGLAYISSSAAIRIVVSFSINSFPP